MFWGGLGVGLGLGIVIIFVLLILNSKGIVGSSRASEAGAGHQKVLVATVENPFSERAINLAMRMAGRRGIVETLYVIEIGLERPLQVVADEEIARGMRALEEASYIGKRDGKRLLPRLEKARMGSKAVLDVQGQEGFGLVVLDLVESVKMEDITRKIAEYVQEKATCTVVVLSGKEEA